MTWLIVTEYMCRKHFRSFFSFTRLDNKQVIRIRKTKKYIQHNGKKTKQQTTIYKTYTLSEHQSSSMIFSGVLVARSLLFCVVFCRSLFVLLPLFFWSLHCLSFNLPHLVNIFPNSNKTTNHLSPQITKRNTRKTCPLHMAL
jgi:hypothetical protein